MSCANAKTIILRIISLIEHTAIPQHLCTHWNPTALLLTRGWLDILILAKHQQTDKVTCLALTFNLAYGLIYLASQCCLRKEDWVIPWKERRYKIRKEVARAHTISSNKRYGVIKSLSFLLGILSNMLETGRVGPEAIPDTRWWYWTLWIFFFPFSMFCGIPKRALY